MILFALKKYWKPPQPSSYYYLKIEKEDEIMSGTFFKMCLHWLILKFLLGTMIFLNIFKPHFRWCFWPKGKMSQNKLITALFLRTNEKNYTVDQGQQCTIKALKSESNCLGISFTIPNLSCPSLNCSIKKTITRILIGWQIE